jgi:hypothetical protein
MTEPFSKIQNRRKLLTDALRFAGVGLLSLVSIASVLKRKGLKYEGDCINSSICGGCRIYEDCGLPQAISRKQATEKKNNGTK